LIYFWLNSGGLGSQGWAIPMATDIVFAAAVLTLLGKVVPPSLKLFLLVLAIVDDIGAIFVIGLFYSSTLSWAPLVLAAGIIALTLWLRRFSRIGVPIFLMMTAALWAALHAAGVQASIAGALIGLFAPATSQILGGYSVGEKLERLLYPAATFIVIPIFALANAGVAVAGINFAGESAVPVALGIFAGLIFGKMTGIAGVVWLAVRTGIADLPKGASWSQVIGTAGVAGIGFTVAIFVTDLSFAEGSNLQAVAKFSIVVTSILAAAIGSLLLRRVAR
jgi:NhaA family Na+:H+ antiporter